jgi:hypothetical protein
MSWLSAAWHWYSAESVSQSGAVDHPHAALVNPVVAGIGAALLIGTALQQAATARRRNREQTDADRQRRITESFSKATEQLGSDKLEVRLGGIYTLERILRESPDDYWTVMENLTAFVRERSRRNEVERTSQGFEQRVAQRAYFLWVEAGRPEGRAGDFWTQSVRRDESGESPTTDIAAVLTMIRQRSEQSRKHELTHSWRIDLSSAILRGAQLEDAHLEEANLRDVHLEWASLGNAYLQRSNLWGAHLERANLRDAHLEGAFLGGAYLEGANLGGAHLEGANLWGAHLKEANIWGTHLKGADLVGAEGLSEAGLLNAHGDKTTNLPAGLTRPSQWPGSDVGDHPQGGLHNSESR